LTVAYNLRAATTFIGCRRFDSGSWHAWCSMKVTGS